MRFILALLLFLHTTPASAETPPIAMSFALDMSGSTHEDAIGGLLPAELQLAALERALRTLAAEPSTCAIPFQLQVVYWGSDSVTMTSWLQVRDGNDLLLAALAVEQLGIINHQGTDHSRMQTYLAGELAASGSSYQMGVIATNEGTNPSVIDELAAQARGSPMHLYGASINDGSTIFYLEAVTQGYTLIRSVSELEVWFVELIRAVAIPRSCVMS